MKGEAAIRAKLAEFDEAAAANGGTYPFGMAYQALILRWVLDEHPPARGGGPPDSPEIGVDRCLYSPSASSSD